MLVIVLYNYTIIGVCRVKKGLHQVSEPIFLQRIAIHCQIQPNLAQLNHTPIMYNYIRQ